MKVYWLNKYFTTFLFYCFAVLLLSIDRFQQRIIGMLPGGSLEWWVGILNARYKIKERPIF